MDANKYKLILDNQKIWNFYNSNPGIDIETANLFFIDFFENIFNHTTRTSENINSQILSFMSDSKKQIELLQSNLASVNENVTKINTDVSRDMVTQLGNLKKEYIDDVRNIISTNSLTNNEKINSIFDKNNEILVNKTTLLLNEVIPKNNEASTRQFQSIFKDFQKQVADETRMLLQDNGGQKTMSDFISNFDTKYTSLLQNVQQPLYTLLTASENRISQNILGLKENTLPSQTKLIDELGEFLGKYKNSSSKGKCGEQRLNSLLNELYPNSEITDTTGMKASGDFIMRRTNKPSILLENKEYDYNIPKDEVQKFIRDIENQNTSGVFISQYSGITFKDNFQIDINKGNVLVYIQNCEYTPDKIRLAVDIIDNLSEKIADVTADEDTNVISKEMLDDINDEFHRYVNQRDGLVMVLRDFNKKMTSQIEDIQFPTLDKYLSQKYASVKARCLVCDLCGDFIARNKQSLSAHKRGCAKTNGKPPSDTIVVNTSDIKNS